MGAGRNLKTVAICQCNGVATQAFPETRPDLRRMVMDAHELRALLKPS